MGKHKKTRILFLDILTGDAKIRNERHKKVYRGKTYSEIMRKAFGLKKDEWVLVDASGGKFPKDIAGFRAVVIGGSLEDPLPGTEKPWVKKTYAVIKQVIKNRIPILGICGGLQFTVRALGGKVILNPKGREFGSIDVQLTRKGMNDPLFKGLSKKIIVASSHTCMAANLKPGWKLLASSKLCRVQAIAIGDRIRLLQFHPEKTARMLKNAAQMKNLKVGQIKNTSRAGKKILQNFLKYFVLKQ